MKRSDNVDIVEFVAPLSCLVLDLDIKGKYRSFMFFLWLSNRAGDGVTTVTCEIETGLPSRLPRDDVDTTPEIFSSYFTEKEESGFEHKAKQIWRQQIKINILRQVGRSNTTANLTNLFHDSINGTDSVEDAISKKIRTFYPSCYIPEAAEMEFRNEDKHMNLFFNYSEDQQARKIATATLRLHRVPSENFGISNTNSKNCTTKSNEQEKRLRVSLYWYIKQQRNKRRGKKRLSDSRVISLNDRYVELDVSSAIYSWTNEGNLGLTIQVEDQDGKTLKTDKYFRGPTCLQHNGRSQQPSWTALELQNSFSAFWEEIQRRPFLVIYYCSPPLTFALWDFP
ncbi:hypothetical protein WA026_011160 [Henosepilachna vigintioctopunctata]|uniref:TGF-beta propeptide domain-containing protein n=1 Tax=Henosepilachna vigintioctopunctata TaxID=420089 RepID=A0AAW1U7D7_9CUCU